MPDKKEKETKIETKKNPTPQKFDFEIKSINIDRAEYEEIILSNSNHPDKDFYR